MAIEITWNDIYWIITFISIVAGIKTVWSTKTETLENQDSI